MAQTAPTVRLRTTSLSASHYETQMCQGEDHHPLPLQVSHVVSCFPPQAENLGFHREAPPPPTQPKGLGTRLSGPAVRPLPFFIFYLVYIALRSMGGSIADQKRETLACYQVRGMPWVYMVYSSSRGVQQKVHNITGDQKKGCQSPQVPRYVVKLGPPTHIPSFMS